MNESKSSFLKGVSGDEPLEFPDWSGHQPHTSRVPNDEWLDYCRMNLTKLRTRPASAQVRRQNGVSVEFRL